MARSKLSIGPRSWSKTPALSTASALVRASCVRFFTAENSLRIFSICDPHSSQFSCFLASAAAMSLSSCTSSFCRTPTFFWRNTGEFVMSSPPSPSSACCFFCHGHLTWRSTRRCFVLGAGANADAQARQVRRVRGLGIFATAVCGYYVGGGGWLTASRCWLTSAARRH